MQFNYNDRSKQGKHAFVSGFRLTEPQFKANKVYLLKQLRENLDIEWRHPMQASVNSQALDQIIRKFKEDFPSFFAHIQRSEQSWVDWALRGMLTTLSRNHKKILPRNDLQAIPRGKTSRRFKPDPEENDTEDEDGDRDGDEDEDDMGMLRSSPLTGRHGASQSAMEVFDVKTVSQPSPVEPGTIVEEIPVLFWSEDGQDVLHICSVRDISHTPAGQQWRPEHLAYDRFSQFAQACDGFDGATCFFKSKATYEGMPEFDRMSIPVKTAVSLKAAGTVLRRHPALPDWNFALVRQNPPITGNIRIHRVTGFHRANWN
jgi:hypothetical protein